MTSALTSRSLLAAALVVPTACDENAQILAAGNTLPAEECGELSLLDNLQILCDVFGFSCTFDTSSCTTYERQIFKLGCHEMCFFDSETEALTIAYTVEQIGQLASDLGMDPTFWQTCLEEV